MSNHTYLRYECADAFGVVTQTATSTRTPAAADGILATTTNNSSPTHLLLSTAASYVIGWNLTTGLPVYKVGHAEVFGGGVGTGRALNTGQVLCLDAQGQQLATGWMDGAVRVFDLPSANTTGGGGDHSTAFSLLNNNNQDDGDDGVGPERPDPLTLNGHTPSPVRVVRFEKNHKNKNNRSQNASSRLASGGSDGSVIVWDLVAESGLFRLLGHQQGITNLEFVANNSDNHESRTNDDYLLSTSLDGLIKVWDLSAQCCVQTLLMAGGGQVWSSTLVDWNWYDRTKSTTTTTTTTPRQRLLTGSVNGQVRVWSVDVPTPDATSSPTLPTNDDTSMRIDDEDPPSQPPPPPQSDQSDTVCRDMGWLNAPSQHLATSSSTTVQTAVASKERVMSIQASPHSRHIGVLQANSKTVHVYAIRSLPEATRKRHRRVQRRQEKQKLQQKQQQEQQEQEQNDDGDSKKRKKGILDDDDDPEEKDQKDQQDDPTTKPTTTPTHSLEDFQANDELEYIGTVRTSHKIKAFVFLPRQPKPKPPQGGAGAGAALLRMACALSTNTLEIVSLAKDSTTTSATTSIPRYISERGTNLTAMHGHPTGVRAMALSTNDDLVVTISKNVAKVWNVQHRSCLLSLTMEAAAAATSKKQQQQSLSCQGLCCVFLPGNSHVVVGTKEGHLLVLDVAACDIVYWKRQAHDDAIWSMDLTYRRGRVDDLATTIVTGSADKTVKFWRMELQSQEEDDDESDEEDVVIRVPGAPMLVPTRMLEMTDEVVAVRYSQNYLAPPDRRMVFVSTLDCTIKVFYEDSLKMFLSLYGHKLPALAVDASDDDVLLASASADKTIKLWGLDFGDTHRTLHGHEDSVTDIAFVRGTHNFFSCSKDGTVRFWDGDRFEMVLVLRGHSAEVNCLAVSARNQGAVCLSGGMDRQVRVWERTRDIVFVEEERERELENMFDDPANRGTQQNEGGTASILARRGGGDADDMEDENREPQTEAAVKQSVMSISAGDRILEAIELADQELQSSRSGSKQQAGTANPMLLGMEPPQYILWVLRSIKSVELEQSLLILPLSHAERLLYYLVILLRGGHTGAEICARVAVFTVKTHQQQLVLKQNSMAPLLRELRRLIRLRVGEARDTVGYNMAACRLIGRLSQERQLNKVSNVMPSTDVWAGLGLGSDVAAALQGSRGARK